MDFVSRADWEKELGALVLDMDIRDSGGGANDEDGAPRNPDAAVVLDKIRAVYPMLSAEEIMSIDVEGLLSTGTICEVLGETVIVEGDYPKAFSRKLTVYMCTLTARARNVPPLPLIPTIKAKRLCVWFPITQQPATGRSPASSASTLKLPLYLPVRLWSVSSVSMTPIIPASPLQRIT